MKKSYLIIWQKSHARNVTGVIAQTPENTSGTGGGEMGGHPLASTRGYNPQNVTRQETPIDVLLYSGEVGADVIYEAILEALEKKVEYDRKQIIIHGVFLL